jgi:hypothetical protein
MFIATLPVYKYVFSIAYNTIIDGLPHGGSIPPAATIFNPSSPDEHTPSFTRGRTALTF